MSTTKNNIFYLNILFTSTRELYIAMKRIKDTTQAASHVVTTKFTKAQYEFIKGFADAEERSIGAQLRVIVQSIIEKDSFSIQK